MQLTCVHKMNTCDKDVCVICFINSRIYPLSFIVVPKEVTPLWRNEPLQVQGYFQGEYEVEGILMEYFFIFDVYIRDISIIFSN